MIKKYLFFIFGGHLLLKSSIFKLITFKFQEQPIAIERTEPLRIKIKPIQKDAEERLVHFVFFSFIFLFN